ncbi:rhodanese-like domain-containing protein, partial [Alphaproteobacteria bacterium]|nr:rhodanese-like domain-containing protein [Alphaproteobacteria bacterium]
MKFLFFLILFFPKILYADIKSIGNDELNFLINNNVNIIDVRTPIEWKKTGIINNSFLISLLNKQNKFVFKEWFDIFRQKVDFDKPIVFVCATGVRSHYISILVNKRLPEFKIYNLTNG